MPELEDEWKLVVRPSSTGDPMLLAEARGENWIARFDLALLRMMWGDDERIMALNAEAQAHKERST